MNRDRLGPQEDWGNSDHCPTAVQCRIRSFARFSRWLDGELAKLERRWAHLAVPTGDVREQFEREFRPKQPR
jgi:hypothetical protein